MKKPVILTILDGFGIRDEIHGNAVMQAKKPNFDRFFSNYPHMYLRADGEFVGLPKGQMGNSEVGHLNIGAGRVVYQSLALINKEIEEKSFFENKILNKAINKDLNNDVHILGLLSDGGVHAHINHIKALIDMAVMKEVNNIYVHAILDGRDVDPKSGINYIKEINDYISDKQNAYLATISGRYYAMDRDKRWDRVELAYDAIVCGNSKNEFIDPIKYVEDSYANNVFDEFVLPGVNKVVNGKIKDNDSVIFANFRPDRAMQLSGVLTNEEYNPNNEENMYKPNYRPNGIHFISMMKYSNDVKGEIAFKLVDLNNTLGEVVANAGLNQVRIAETEKYPHVTFFFDGGVETELENQKRILIPSPKVATYDLKPEMSAYEVCDALIENLEQGNTDLVILNFANPDMVGHSGMLEPTMKAIEAVDECLGKIIDKVIELGGSGIITADHGNADKVLNDDESPNTAHTTNKVPAIVLKEGVHLVDSGALCDLAPTILELLGVEQPKEMTGKSLIKK